MACFSIPTASRECFSQFLSWVILAFLDLTFAYESCMALLYALQILPLATAWPTSACWIPWAPKSLFSSTAALTCFLYIFCVFFKMTFVHTYMINCQGTRFLTVFCHFTCTTPFVLAMLPQLKHTLWSLTFWKFVMCDWPSAECLNGQSADMQYRLPRHLPISLSLLAPFFSMYSFESTTDPGSSAPILVVNI